MDINVARKERKKIKKIREVINKAAPIKSPISPFIFSALMVLMYGIPETRRSIPVVFSNFSIFGIKFSIIKVFLAAVLTIFLFK